MSYIFIRFFLTLCIFLCGTLSAFAQFEDRTDMHKITEQELASSLGARALMNFAREKNPLSENLVANEMGVSLKRKCYGPGDLDPMIIMCRFSPETKMPDILELTKFGSAATDLKNMIGGSVEWEVPLSAGCMPLSIFTKFIGIPPKKSLDQPVTIAPGKPLFSKNIINYDYFYDVATERNYININTYKGCLTRVALIKPYP